MAYTPLLNIVSMIMSDDPTTHLEKLKNMYSVFSFISGNSREKVPFRFVSSEFIWSYQLCGS